MPVETCLGGVCVETEYLVRPNYPFDLQIRCIRPTCDDERTMTTAR